MWNYADNPYLTALAAIYVVATFVWLKGVEHAERHRVDPAHSCARCGSLRRRDGGEIMCSQCIEDINWGPK